MRGTDDTCSDRTATCCEAQRLSWLCIQEFCGHFHPRATKLEHFSCKELDICSGVLGSVLDRFTFGIFADYALDEQLNDIFKRATIFLIIFVVAEFKAVKMR